MKHVKIIIVLAAMFCSFLGSSLFAGSQDFTIVNHTGHDIMRIFISDSGSDKWGPDRLTGYLRNGESTKFTFTNYDQANWDIKIVYRTSKGDAVFNRMNLKKIYKIVLTSNSSGGTHATYYEID